MKELEQLRLEWVRRLFEGEQISGEEFALPFLRTITPAQLREHILQLVAKWGTLLALEPGEDFDTVVLERAELPLQLFVDAYGKIAGLRVLAEVPVGGSVEEHAEALRSLGQEVGILIESRGRVVYAHKAEEPMGVGSAFKVGVLVAVMRMVARGRLGWDEVFRARSRSLPSGILQDWPSEVGLTLMTLCCLMISLSDNTATDALIEIVGREAVGTVLGVPDTSALTTRELFLLQGREETWARADESERRRLLDGLDGEPHIYAATALAPDGVGWQLSAVRIRQLLQESQGHPAFRIHPGPALKRGWKRVAFKGGQQPGMQNVSLLLVDDLERESSLVVTLHGAASIDGELVMLHVRAILRLLEWASQE